MADVDGGDDDDEENNYGFAVFLITLLLLLAYLCTSIWFVFYGDCKGDVVNDNIYNLLMLFVFANGPVIDADGETGADNDILDGKFVC